MQSDVVSDSRLQVVVLFVPLRLTVLPRWFSEVELEALDSEHTFTEDAAGREPTYTPL